MSYTSPWSDTQITCAFQITREQATWSDHLCPSDHKRHTVRKMQGSDLSYVCTLSYHPVHLLGIFLAGPGTMKQQASNNGANHGLNGGGAAAVEGLAESVSAALPPPAGDDVCFEGGCPTEGEERPANRYKRYTRDSRYSGSREGCTSPLPPPPTCFQQLTFPGRCTRAWQGRCNNVRAIFGEVVSQCNPGSSQPPLP